MLTWTPVHVLQDTPSFSTFPSQVLVVEAAILAILALYIKCVPHLFTPPGCTFEGEPLRQVPLLEGGRWFDGENLCLPSPRHLRQ